MELLKGGMSSFDIAVVTAELDRLLEGFGVDNIYQPNPKSLLLKLRGGGGFTHLLLEAGRRVHTTSYVLEKPLTPPGFCMALRKYLRNGVVEKVSQHGFERIVEVAVKATDGGYRLVTELFGQGNSVLVDPEGKILHALSYRRMRDRNIIRGEAFLYPPPRGRDPRSLRREDLEEIKGYGELGFVKGLVRFLSLSGTYAEEVLLRAGVEKDTPCSSLRGEELDAVLGSLQGLLAEIASGNVKPCAFVGEGGGWVDVAPAPLKNYDHLERVYFNTFNEALDEFYAKVSVGEKVSDVKDVLGREAAQLQRRLREQEEALKESKRKAELFQRIGDAIYGHLGELQLLLQRVMGAKRGGKGWDEIREELVEGKRESRVPAVFFESLSPESLSLRVSVEGQVFDLDFKLSAQDNAAEYYSRAKKAKRRLRGAETAVEETKTRIEEARSRLVEKVEETAKPMPKKREREWYEKFRWFRSSDGFLVIGGRDASTNEVIVRRHMEPRDIVFHAEVAGAPFVLVKTEGKAPSDEAVAEAAQFAASYSRAWREGLGSMDVYWVKPEQVGKGAPSGEYLPRGSFMIYGKRNYVKGVRLEVAVGVKREADGLRVIGGPPDAVSKQTGVSVKLVPGGESSGRLAKEVRSRLARLSSEEERGEVLRLPLEEFQGFIPAGRGAVV